MKNKKFIKFLTALLAVALSMTCMACESDKNDENNQDVPKQEVVIPTYTAPSEIDYQGYNTFYFDGTGGNDANSGKSPLAPKQSLKEMTRIASTATEDYPIRLLLKRGSVFSGSLTLTGYSALKEKPLVVSDYGSSEDLPKLVGLNNDTDTIYSVIKLTESNTRISNLEITDPYAYQGINIYAVRVGKLENIVIDGCYVHDVNFFWDEEKYDQDNPPTSPQDLDAICPEFNSVHSYGRAYYRTNGGIIFQNDTKANIGASWFENVYAINNTVERVGRTGIYMSTKWSNAPGVGYGYNKFVEESDKYNDAENGIGYFMHKNVNFVGNKLNLIGGDGIILAGTDSCLENNVCYRANYLGRMGGAPTTGNATQYFNAAIWVYNSNRVSFKGNEAAYTFLRNGAGDGEGFDIDNACKNVVFENNYAHHNEGGGLLICNSTVSLLRYDKDGNCISPNGKAESLLGNWGNNYCRNNVFAFNGSADYSRSAFVTIARPTNNFYCYNNTVIVGGHQKQNIINQEDSSVNVQYYANNIICAYSPVEGTFNLYTGKATFENNLYHNVGSPYEDKREGGKLIDAKSITSINPEIETVTTFDGYDKVSLFKAKNENVYQLGLIIDGASKFDILGLATENIKYLGAFAG